MNAVVVVAHAPLASALRSAALHVLPQAAADVVAVDVEAGHRPELVLAQLAAALYPLRERAGVLMLADMLGATPCNLAVQAMPAARACLLAGASLPMLLRALDYRHEPLARMAQRALEGGVAGACAPQPSTADR